MQNQSKAESINALKIESYDLLVQSEQLKAELALIQQKIIALSKQIAALNASAQL